MYFVIASITVWFLHYDEVIIINEYYYTNSPLTKKPFQQNRPANNIDIIVDTDIHIVENVNTKNTTQVL